MVDLVHSNNSNYLRIRLISFDQVNIWISVKEEEEGR